MTTPCEEWRDVVGFTGRYFVSTRGQVRSVDGGRGHRVVCLRPFPQQDHGYLRVNLSYAPGRWIQRGVHQLVAAAFIGPVPLGHCVNHKDGNKTNNHVDNLEYVTPAQNAAHAKRLGLLVGQRGEHNGAAKLRLDMVMDIKGLLGKGWSDKQLAKMFWVLYPTIAAIRNKKTWGWVPAEFYSAESYEHARRLQDRLVREPA